MSSSDCLPSLMSVPAEPGEGPWPITTTEATATVLLWPGLRCPGLTPDRLDGGGGPLPRATPLPQHPKRGAQSLPQGRLGAQRAPRGRWGRRAPEGSDVCVCPCLCVCPCCQRGTRFPWLSQLSLPAFLFLLLLVLVSVCCVCAALTGHEQDLLVQKSPTYAVAASSTSNATTAAAATATRTSSSATRAAARLRDYNREGERGLVI